MVQNTLIIVSSITMIVLSVFLYRLATGKPIWSINMLSMSFWILGTLCFIPSLLVVLNIGVFRSFDDDKLVYGNFDNRLKGWIIQYWVMIGLPLGALLARLALPKRINQWTGINIYKIAIGGKYTEKILFRTITLVFVIFATTVVIRSGTNNPLFIALSGGTVIDILVSRNEFNAGTGIGLLDLMLRSDTMIIFSLISFAFAIRTKKVKWWLLFLSLFLFVIFLSVLSASTGTIIFYIIIILYLRYLITGKFVNAYQFLYMFGSLFLAFMFLKSGDEATTATVSQHIFNRIFFEQARGFYFALQIFPDINPFIGFSSSAVWLNNLLGVTPSLDYGFILMNHFTPEGVESGVAGHFTSIFVTEMWANFGWSGVLLGPIWAGVVIYLVYYLFTIRKPALLDIVFYTHISIWGFGYFSDFVRFYYPVNTLFIYLGAYMILKIGHGTAVMTHALFSAPRRISGHRPAENN